MNHMGMKKFFVVFSILTVLTTSCAYGVENKPCSKSKLNKIENNFICKKINKKYRWVLIMPTSTKQENDKETNTPAPILPVETNNNVSNKIENHNYELCGIDPKIPNEWSIVETWFIKNKLCSPVYRLVEKDSYGSLPNISITKNNTNPEECKIKQNNNKQNVIAFPNKDRLSWWNSSKHPSPNTVYQVVPIYFNDSGQPDKSPLETYGKYFNFIEKWTKYSSDVESNVQFRVHNEYIKINENLSNYNFDHMRSDADAIKINNMLQKNIDSKINFSGANVVIFVVPPSTNPKLVGQVGLDRIKTNEGTMISIVFPPLNLNENLGYDTMKFMLPSWWLHQLMHTGPGFDDNRQNNMIDGTNQWGLINGFSAGDLFIWQKWLLGFIEDGQVSCFTNNQNFVSWIAPSTHKIKENKMTVIKISESKAIFFESIRASGLNYKVDSSSIGVRVYLLDTSLTSRQDGIRVIQPENRVLTHYPLINSDASFKKGDYFIYGKKKISVLESGDFGDIISVQDIGL